MEELLKAILSGVSDQPGRPQQGGDPMMDLLGGILGGAGVPQPSSGRSGGDPIGDLIGGILGGAGGQQSSGALSDLLGAVLGGGGLGGGQSSRSNPLVNILVEKVGLPPIIAQMAVSYFMAKMLAGKMGTPAGLSGSGFQPGTARSNVFDLDHLLGEMDDEQALQSNLMSSGMPQELAQAAGIDQETAMRSLAEMLRQLGQQTQAPKPVTTRQANLKGLLDNWEVE